MTFIENADHTKGRNEKETITTEVMEQKIMIEIAQ